MNVRYPLPKLSKYIKLNCINYVFNFNLMFPFGNRITLYLKKTNQITLTHISPVLKKDRSFLFATF